MRPAASPASLLIAVFGVCFLLALYWQNSIVESRPVCTAAFEPAKNATTRTRAGRLNRMAVVLSSYLGPDPTSSRVNHMLTTWLEDVTTIVALDKLPENTPPSRLHWWAVAPDDPDHLNGIAWSGNNKAEARKLAGLAHLQRHHRGTFDWVVVIDDDSFVFLESLQGHLARFDADQPWAFGMLHPVGRSCDATKRCCTTFDRPCVMATPFTQADLDADSYCPVAADGRMPRKMGFNKEEGVNIYHGPAHWPYGGSSFVISRGAMDLLSDDEWDRCRDAIVCDGGDVRVAVCLQSKNVQFTHMPGLTQNAPPRDAATAEAHRNTGTFSYHRVDASHMPILANLKG